jgi:hypothetical protein
MRRESNTASRPQIQKCLFITRFLYRGVPGHGTIRLAGALSREFLPQTAATITDLLLGDNETMVPHGRR